MNSSVEAIMPLNITVDVDILTKLRYTTQTVNYSITFITDPLLYLSVIFLNIHFLPFSIFKHVHLMEAMRRSKISRNQILINQNSVYNTVYN